MNYFHVKHDGTIVGTEFYIEDLPEVADKYVITNVDDPELAEILWIEHQELK